MKFKISDESSIIMEYTHGCDNVRFEFGVFGRTDVLDVPKWLVHNNDYVYDNAPGNIVCQIDRRIRRITSEGGELPDNVNEITEKLNMIRKYVDQYDVVYSLRKINEIIHEFGTTDDEYLKGRLRRYIHFASDFIGSCKSKQFGPELTVAYDRTMDKLEQLGLSPDDLA